MTFSKAFPKKVEGVSYPIWEDVSLLKDEELSASEKARLDNIKIMKECLTDSKQMFSELNLSNYQSDVVRVACYMFDKRASHEVFYKEEMCKEKFEKKYNKNL
jgi:hypothetical protein